VQTDILDQRAQPNLILCFDNPTIRTNRINRANRTLRAPRSDLRPTNYAPPKLFGKTRYAHLDSTTSIPRLPRVHTHSILFARPFFLFNLTSSISAPFTTTSPHQPLYASF
jgi:hypothetical protein